MSALKKCLSAKPDLERDVHNNLRKLLHQQLFSFLTLNPICSCMVYVLMCSPPFFRGRPSAGDNRNEHWSLSHSPVEHVTSSSNGLHGNHLYASVSGYAVDRPLALTKSGPDIGAGSRERSVISGTVERQQV